MKQGYLILHKRRLTLLKFFYNEQKPLIQYRSCKNNTMNVIDNNTFLRTVKHLLTDKVKTRSKITLIENRKV